MDQLKIGRFIAVERKRQGLTQRQLAEQLSISDKTISKWECGKGLPEVSLMLPLCKALQIGVNDLLSGERLCEDNYRKRAEENLMNLIEENRENKNRMLYSVLCVGVTVVAVSALVALASFLTIPVPARILLLLLAVLTGVTGIFVAAQLAGRAGHYGCPHCNAQLVPSMRDYVKGYHTLTRRRLTCPHCGRTGMCRHRIVR